MIRDLLLLSAHSMHTVLIWGCILFWRDCERWLCAHVANQHELWSALGCWGLPLIWVAAIVAVNELQLRRWF